jgi:hypothetical protein
MSIDEEAPSHANLWANYLLIFGLFWIVVFVAFTAWPMYFEYRTVQFLEEWKKRDWSSHYKIHRRPGLVYQPVTHVELSRARYLEVLPRLKSFPHLRELSIMCDEQLTVEEVAVLKSLPSLQQLNILCALEPTASALQRQMSAELPHLLVRCDFYETE